MTVNTISNNELVCDDDSINSNSHERSSSLSPTTSIIPNVNSLRPPIVKEMQHAGWTIQSIRSSIASTTHTEALSREIGFPLPTMFFGTNRVVLRSSSSEGFELYFDPIEAIRSVPNTAASVAVRVAASRADFWKEKSMSESVFDYDWTYTPQEYYGKITGNYRVETDDPTLKIDYNRLKQHDPIVFFDENILYEDELGDNGISLLSVKIRVMNYGFYVLLNHFLRVDQVVFKSVSARYFHDFSTNYIIKEIKHAEDSFEAVTENLLAKGENISSFKDIDLVQQILPIKSTAIEKIIIKN